MREKVWVLLREQLKLSQIKCFNWSSCDSPRQRKTRARFEVRSNWLQARRWADTKGRVEGDECIDSSSSVQCQVQCINAERERNMSLRTTGKHW